MNTPYKNCSRDDPADCERCGRPLAGDNDSGICWQCRRLVGMDEDQEEIDEYWFQVDLFFFLGSRPIGGTVIA